MPPAARVNDPTAHGPPLNPGPGCASVLIGYMPAWRGIPLAMVAGLQAAKTASDIAIKAAEAATLAAAGTPGAPAAKAAEETLKAQQAAQMGSMISNLAGGCGADIHICPIPLPIPPHGPGVVTTPSATVLIDKLGAARQGDTILEAIGPPDKIAMGCPTVLIGG